MLFIFILLLNSDSAHVDTIRTYEIPKVIDLRGSFSTTIEITPKNYELSIAEVFNSGPFILYDYGDGLLTLLSVRGRDPRYMNVFLNGHPIKNHLLGYFNLSSLPAQFFDKVESGHALSGAEFSAINFVSKINQYDRPYSYIQFATGDFGKNIYNIDLTRAITNEFGLYFSGIYYGFQGYRENSDFDFNSLYANFYYNRFIPMRLDFLYFSDKYGFPGSTVDTIFGDGNNKFFDMSFACGYDVRKIVVYYNLNNIDYRNSITDITVKSKISNFGLATESHYNFKGFELSYGFDAYMSEADGDYFDAYSTNTVDFWIVMNRSVKRFIMSASSYATSFDFDDYFYNPKIALGIDIFNSTYVSVALSRDFRKPSIVEKSPHLSEMNPYHNIKGNDVLRTEYCWTQELSIRRKNFLLGFYKLDVQDFIGITLDDGDYVYANLADKKLDGLESFLKIPIRFESDDTNTITELGLGFRGNYFLKGYAIPYLPRAKANISVSFERLTTRFSFGLILKAEHIGAREDLLRNEIAGFNILSLGGFAQFMGLSCTVRLKNVFDAYYAYVPNYPMAPRNFDISIKWEFWD